MKILQNDIFGKKHDTKPEKEKKVAASSPKTFPGISLKDEITESQATANAMLIHRGLERKLIYSRLESTQAQKKFIKILKNELKIKAGIIDTVTATRDSLLTFFTNSFKK